MPAHIYTPDQTWHHDPGRTGKSNPLGGDLGTRSAQVTSRREFHKTSQRPIQSWSDATERDETPMIPPSEIINITHFYGRKAMLIPGSEACVLTIRCNATATSLFPRAEPPQAG